MRKNIKNKILLSILAAGVFYLPAYADAASLTITAGENGAPVFNYGTGSGDVDNWVHNDDATQSIYYNGKDDTGSNNTITIFNGNNDSTLKLPSNGGDTLYIYGANANITDGGTAELKGNQIYFDSNSGSNTLQLNSKGNYLNGAYAIITGSGSATLSSNSIAITGGNTFTTSGEGASLSINGASSNIKESGSLSLNKNNIAITGSNSFTTSGSRSPITIYGAFANHNFTNGSVAATLTGNYFNITGSNSFETTGEKSNIDLHGAYLYNKGYKENTQVKGNSIKITGSNTFKANGTINLYGARAYIIKANDNSSANASISQNYLDIAASSFTGSTNLYGAYIDIPSDTYDAEVKGNYVKINDGVTFNSATNIYGAYVNLLGTAAIDNNSVIISGGEFEADTNVYAAYLNYLHGTITSITGNSITLSGNAGSVIESTNNRDLSSVNLYGYDYSGSPSEINASNSTLVVDGWSGTVKSVNNFDSIEFNNISVSKNTETTAHSVFYISSDDNKGLESTTVNINSVAAGDYEAGTELSGLLTLDKKITDTQIKIAESLNEKNVYYASNYGTDGIIANKASQTAAQQIEDDENGNRQIKIYTTIAKTVYAGKLTNADGTILHNTNQTADTASLTLDKDLSGTNASVIAGAYAVASSKEGTQNDATGGKLTLTSGSKFAEGTNLYAGYAENGNATGNTMTLTGSADVSNVNLFGANENGSNNTLAVNDWSGKVKSVNKFSAITFDNITWQNGGEVLQITESAENALQGTTVTINNLNFAGGTPLTVGDSMTFIANSSSNGTNLGQSTVQAAGSFLAGVAVEGTGSATVAKDGSVIYTIDAIKLTPQAQGVAQTRAASAAFLNQSTDLISDSLDVLGRDGSYGVKTFAAVQGNRSSYDVADDLKINGWSVIAGFGAENEHKGGDFAWGVFYENGSGNYRTYNTFNNEFFRGDGSMVYNGGGIAARYENAKGVYTEGSLRAGMLKNEMDNALHDGAGNSYGYETESTYYGAHIGVGQIFEIDENTDLDVYGKFFHTYTEGDSVTIGGDTFDFDSITSDRLRVGARVTKQQAKVNTYYGLAYEYEFNGDADMTAQGIKADTQSFGGGSGIAELGFNYQPGTDSPWNFDLNLRGYVGERQGGSFNVQATYSF